MQVGHGTHSGRLAGIDVADNDDVDVALILLAVVSLAMRATRWRRCRGFGCLPHFDGVYGETESDLKRLARKGN